MLCVSVIPVFFGHQHSRSLAQLVHSVTTKADDLVTHPVGLGALRVGFEEWSFPAGLALA